MKKLIIIGASGQGRTIADIAKLIGYEHIYFLDDHDYSEELGRQYLGRIESAIGYKEEFEFIVGIGNCKVRKEIMNKFDVDYVNIIHPSAVISDAVRFGKGSLVMAGAVINNDVIIGDGVMVTTCSSVDHNCTVGDYVLIGVGAHLCGTVYVDECTWIGAGATVNNNTSICADCMIGSGAVIVKDIIVSGTYVGIPAKRIK